MTTTNATFHVDPDQMIGTSYDRAYTPLLSAEVRPDGSIRAFCPHANRHFSCGHTDTVSERTEVLSHLCCVDDCPIVGTGFRVDIVGPIDSVPLPARRRNPYYDRFGQCLSGLLRAERKVREAEQRARNPKRRS